MKLEELYFMRNLLLKEQLQYFFFHLKIFNIEIKLKLMNNMTLRLAKILKKDRSTTENNGNCAICLNLFSFVNYSSFHKKRIFRLV